MPRVPTYDNLQTSVSAQPAVQFQSPTAPTPGAIASEQASQFGKALTGAGDMLGKIQMDMSQQVNEVRVMDAVNKAKEKMYDLTYNKDTGYSMQKGINALERPDGADLATEYSRKFQQDIDGIGAGLGNDVQKIAFNRAAGAMRTDMYGSAERHMSQEFTQYQGSVYDGATSNAQRQIALNYADVAKGGQVEQGVASIEAATRAKARLAGLSQEFADTQVRKAVSNAHVLALSSALEKNDVGFASGYLQKFSGQMDADDILKMQGHVTKEMDLRQAGDAATKAVASVTPRMFNTDASRAFSAMSSGPIDVERAFVGLKGTESNNRQFDKAGNPLQSTIVRNGQKVEGAIGIAQVMRGTGPEAAKLAGLPWDEGKWKNDATYNAAIGKAYFEEQIRTFGNLPMAYAAYNAGPGRTAQEIKDAAKRGVPDAWLSNMPPETRDYVKKNMDKYNGGPDGGTNGGGMQAPMPTLMEVHASVANALGPNARPQVLAAAKQLATQQFEDLTKAKASADTEKTANAMREVVQNGGSYSSLSASVRASLPPKEIDNVMNFAARVSKGDDTTNSALYLKLTQPGTLAKLTDNEFFMLRGQLNESDFKGFAKERATLMSGGGANGFGELNTGMIKDTIDSRMRQLKFDVTPKDGSNEAAQLGTVHRFVRNEVAQAQQQAGRKFNDVETSNFVDKLFATNVQFKNSILGFTYGGASSQSLLANKQSDVPSDVRKAIVDDFAKRGNLKPTDADVLGVYLQYAKNKPQAAMRGTNGNY